ncbi:hypothetical protein L2E82_43870 [Cichorium intybus]|uniref:Uncharacterized protein n=1 Tax=Cichorium intybus TaxID=13427 RepID=A0ACB8ZPG5_CICIN|nr:hypothetical protein L2E82_43870 [Cichorium intybus]
MATISNKDIKFGRRKRRTGGTGNTSGDGVAEFGDDGLWQREILMGDKYDFESEEERLCDQLEREELERHLNQKDAARTTKTLSKIATNGLEKELMEWQVNPPTRFKHKVTDNLQR